MRRLAIAALALAAAACNASGDTVTAPPSELTDPATVARTGRPNDYLVCPPRACAAAPDRPSPVYQVAAEHVAEAWRSVVAAAPRTRALGADPARGIELFEQRSALFGFRDTILVRFVPLEDGQSTLIVYSRSEVGYWDLGVNRARVESWLASLDTELSARASR